MALNHGTRIGPYEVSGALGAGGMGEVYRARDSKLQREVAIKVLPQAFAHDAERLARFEREARTLASLNHPNIAHVYGLEDANGSKALVMELVDGPTLADRIAEGGLPRGEVLVIARQIIDALEAAHEQGIVHRDLKPANIKVTPDGVVKVLDFGLAKMVDPSGGSMMGSSQLPTITTPAMTQAGMILGTAAYMSPEQAKGRPTDKRTDVWAFGCVLFEMLTGQRAFAGEDVADTLAFVLTKEPDWSALPSDTPEYLRSLLRRCLESPVMVEFAEPGFLLMVRDGVLMAQRFDVESFRLTGEPTVLAESVQVSPGNGRVGVSASSTGVLVYTQGAGQGGADSQLVWVDRSGRELSTVGRPANIRGFELSPDGRRIALHVEDLPGRGDIWVHDLGRGTTARLTFDPEQHNQTPVWTRDSQTVVFSKRRRLGIYEKDAQGVGVERLVHQSPIWPSSTRSALVWTAG